MKSTSMLFKTQNLWFCAIAIIAMFVFVMTGCGNTDDNDDPIDPVVVNIFAIEGITVPAVGVTPSEAITPNDQYSGTVRWEPAVTETFAAGTQYTATITLTAKAGYTMQGVGANCFTVQDAETVSNAANSGIVTAVFPTIDAELFQNQTPVADDFNISGAIEYTYDGIAKSVSITPKAGKSTGAITIYYNGSTAAPSAVGTYTVTFNVAAATGFNAANGLPAGTLTINAATKTYSVSFVTNGGSPVTARDVEEGGIIGAVNTSRTGFNLEGWYRDSSFITPWNLATDTVNADIVLYAKWAAAPNVVSVEFAGLGYEKIDLTVEGNMNTISISANDHLVVSVEGDWTDYDWYLDGEYKIAYQTNTFDRYGSDFEKPGIHTITAVVCTMMNDYVYYSKELTFKVVR